jgi:hypothetical protein
MNHNVISSRPEATSIHAGPGARPLYACLSCAFAIGLGLVATGCIAPPCKCECPNGKAGKSGSKSGSDGASSDSSSGGGSVEEQVAALELVPVVPSAAIVWDGENESRGGNNIALINLDPAGSWFVFNDGTEGGEMAPPSTGDFTTAVVEGAVHTTGKGFKEWGGGIGFNFVGNPMLTPVDASKYKGITFKASGKGWVHVGLATVITLPEFNICSAKCYDHYMTDIQLTGTMKTYEFTWDRLKQIGWGAPIAPLDTKTIVGLNFTSKGPTSWDFTLDDVGFLE